MEIALVVVFAAAVLALNIWAFVACWQKGRKTMFWLSWLGLIVPVIGILHWFGALRLGRPDSTWAQNRYGPEKMAQSLARFGKPTTA